MNQVKMKHYDIAYLGQKEAHCPEANEKAVMLEVSLTFSFLPVPTSKWSRVAVAGTRWEMASAQSISVR